MATRKASAVCNEPKTLRTGEIAKRYGVSCQAVRNWIAVGCRGLRLRGVMAGGTWRVERADLDAFIERLTKDCTASDVPVAPPDSSSEAMKRQYEHARKVLKERYGI